MTTACRILSETDEPSFIVRESNFFLEIFRN
jgi:hypothetical protein